MGLRDRLRAAFVPPPPDPAPIPEPIAASAPVEVEKAAPTKPIGVGGQAVYAGYLVENEKSPDLTGSAKWTNYAEWKRNEASVAAGLRRFLEFVGAPNWTIPPFRVEAPQPSVRASSSVTATPRRATRAGASGSRDGDRSRR